MELLDWIPADSLSYQMLHFNKNALDYLEKNQVYMASSIMCTNPSAIKYLYRDPSLLKEGIWFKNKNPAIIPILEKCEYIDSPWVQEQLLENPHALHLVKPHYIKHNLYNLCKNTNPLAIDLMEYYLDNADTVSEVIWDAIGKNPSALKLIVKYFDKMRWKSLSENPGAIHILLQNPDEIRWSTFSKNTHPLAIEHIRKNLNKVDWVCLNMNPAAIDILKENPDKIVGYWLSCNFAIFEYNYTKMATERIDIIRDELISVALHPSRVCKWLKQGLTLADI